MKKLFFLILLTILSVCAMAQTQTPVIAAPPYIFQKYMHVKGSLFSDSTLSPTDNSNRVATTSWVMSNISVHVGSGLSGTGVVGNPITWGGTLTTNTTVNAGANNLNLTGTNGTNTWLALGQGGNYTIESYLNSNFNTNSLLQIGTTALLQANNATTGSVGQISISSSTIDLNIYNGTSHQNSELTHTGTIWQLKDGIGNSGIQYYADYSANNLSNPRWIIDKGYADATYATIAGASYTASNGITQSGNNFTFGGTLTGNTTLSLGTNQLNFSETVLSTTSNPIFKIDPTATNQYNFLVSIGGGSHSPTGSYTTLSVGQAEANISALPGSAIGGLGSSVDVQYDRVVLSGRNAGTIFLNSSGLQVQDLTRHLGLINLGDYSTNERLNTNALASIGAAKQIADSVKSTITVINGTGFVKASGTTISYDNSTYLTTATAASTYAPINSPTFTGNVVFPSATTSIGTTTNGTLITTGGTGSIVVNSTTGTGNSVNSTSPSISTPTLVIPTITGGYYYVNGSTSGQITIQTQAAAGTYVFGLPTSAGTSGQVLTSGGGGTANPMTWTTLGSNAFTSTTYAPLASPTFTGTVTLPIASSALKLNTTSKGALITSDGAGTVIVQATNPLGGVGNVVLDASPSISTPTLVIPTITGGHYYVNGSTGGTITFQAQATSGTYNWNYPTTAGNSGDVLTSTAGGTSAMTWTTLGSNAFTSTAYAPLASPALTGTPTAPTPATADNSTTIATTAYVQANFTANTYYFTPGMFSGSGTAGSNFNWGTATIPASSLSATGTASANTFLSGANTWSAIPIAAINATGTASSSTYLRGDGTWSTVSGGSSGANPTASVGLSVVNGVASTFMRSDAAPAIDQTIAPTWTGVHTFSVTNTASSGSNYGLKITNTVNQTGTAAFTDLFVNRTNTASGSGGQYLIDLQVGSSSKFNVNTGGFITTPSGIGLGGSSNIGFYSTSGTFSQDALTLVNNAVAASGTPSLNSPRFHYLSSVWNTTPTAAANYAHIISEMRTVSGTAPTYAIYWAGNLSTSTTPGTFTDLMKLDNSANLSLLNTVSTKHIIGSSSAPTIAAGTGAGTSPTVVISAGGTDMSGVISVSTGTSPAGSNAVIATVTFNTAYGSAPKVVIHPGNSVTAALTGAQYAFTPALAQPNGPTTTTFSVVSGGTALAASTAYYWTYEVMQ